MKAFIPINASWRVPSGLVAIGTGPIDGDYRALPDSGIAVHQMDASDCAGEVETIQLAGGECSIRATITDPVAVLKLKEDVYAGFALIAFKGPGGELRVQRVALVDSPNVIGKRSGGRSVPLALKLDKGISMTSLQRELVKIHGSPPSRRSILVDDRETARLVREARDRQQHAIGLAKASERTTRYKAPAHLRGSSMRLANGQRLDIPEHGFCELADAGAHPSYGPQVASAAHRQLIDAGFRVVQEGEPGAPDMIKSALRHPIVGDQALITFLSRNAARH